MLPQAGEDIKYQFNGKSVCLKAFSTIYDFSKKTVLKGKREAQQEAPRAPPSHGNKGSLKRRELWHLIVEFLGREASSSGDQMPHLENEVHFPVGISKKDLLKKMVFIFFE